ncbi:MAG: PaaX family transcriptional regulator C-terminal domain-containing protein [Paracoccaceae bacterium]
MDPLAPLIASLRAEGRLRVWSLVITAFGDLVRHRGGAITTTRLNTLLGRIGVEPGALRTALSRLDSDGWIERERTGRTSVCRLSREGLAQFDPATSVIYAAPASSSVEEWSLSITLGEGAPTVRLVPAGSANDKADATVTGRLDDLSPKFRAAYLEPAYRAALETLAQDLAALPQVSDPLDAAAARLLLIHRWRRIVLRFPEPLPQLLPSDAPLADPRADVARAYAALSDPAEAWLSADCGTVPGMPPADHAYANRFGLSAKA